MEITLPFRSKNMATLFKELHSGPKLAKQLANLIKTESKEIYPRLKRYIVKGWVKVRKVNNVNVYSLTEAARKILESKGSFEKVKEKAEEILGHRLDEDETEVLRVFYESKYIENSRDETIAEQVYYAVRKRNRKITLTRVEEILKEFTLRRIVFAFRLRSGQILKARLDKSLLQ
ncbi:conjugal transfer protein [Acidianus manzaensis]|nr:conjugal transfer protein [Acidianus manzaensis]